MIKSIEFYYDFTSPYSFIAHKRIREMEKKESINFIYKPILLGGLHKLAGITAPAFIKAKKKFIFQDCQMIANKFNINFKFNDKFPINSLNLMRGVLVINKELKNKYIDHFFDDIKKQETKDLLKKLTKEVFDKEIFGAPTFIVNNKLFWGQDRLDYAIDEFLN